MTTWPPEGALTHGRHSHADPRHDHLKDGLLGCLGGFTQSVAVFVCHWDAVLQFPGEGGRSPLAG